jgi:hypothetical protein
MKIFFTGSQDGKDKIPDVYEQIISTIKKDHTLYSRNYVNFEDTPDEIEKQFIDTYNLAKKNIVGADLVIAESTYPTTSIGYDIALSVENNRPTLLLIDDKIDRNILPSSIRGNKSKHLIISFYNNKNIDEKIKSFIEQGKKMLDSKFIFITPPHIDRYLTWANKRKGIPKADIVRNSVEEHMERDDVYKEHLKEDKD